MADALHVSEVSGFALATVMTRKNVTASMIGAVLNVPPPEGPSLALGQGLSLIGTGPGVWFAFKERCSDDWCHEIAKSLEGLASISDQSSGYIILRFTNIDARTILQRGASIDLSSSAFRDGTSAATMIAHISVWIWQTDERPTYYVAMYRSFADSFRCWLDAAVAAL